MCFWNNYQEKVSTLKYAIVEFVDNKSVEAVPVKWLTEQEDMCCWPPSTRYFSALVKYLADPTDDWMQ